MPLPTQAEYDQLVAELDRIKRQAGDATEYVLAGINAGLTMENRELRAEVEALRKIVASHSRR